jgi:GNAT superfamily N-acetyltransferase
MEAVISLTSPPIGSIPTTVRSRSGRALSIHLAGQADHARITDLLLRLSTASLLRRYLTPRPLTLQGARVEATRILAQANHAGAALLITVLEGTGEAAVALAELAIDKQDTTRAEVALVVRDDYQADGIGALLTQTLVAEARRVGVTTLGADFLPANLPIRRLFTSLGLPYSLTVGPTEWHLELCLAG